MRNKLIYCIPLALSITCLIGCAAKAAQMPAEPEPVALLPEQKQSSIVTNDARNETIPTPQQSEHEDTPVRIVESTPADTPGKCRNRGAASGLCAHHAAQCHRGHSFRDSPRQDGLCGTGACSGAGTHA